jgi:hypothetical protein
MIFGSYATLFFLVEQDIDVAKGKKVSTKQSPALVYNVWNL